MHTIATVLIGVSVAFSSTLLGATGFVAPHGSLAVPSSTSGAHAGLISLA